MNNKSFTLIEILVVIVVIGILSAFILVGTSSITSSANIAKSKAFINSMDNSLLLARVSQWKLDQKDGAGPFTTPDAWGINTGTLMDVDGNCSTTKCPQLVTSGCPFGNCLSFDGINDYVDCGSGSSLDITGTMTLSIWIKGGGDIGEADGLIAYYTSNYQPYRLDLSLSGSNARVRFLQSQSGTSWDTQIITNDLFLNTDTNWHHIVATNNGSNAYIYVDSINRGSDLSPASSLMSLGLNPEIGRYYSNYFHGLIDDVRIYNQPIPTSEIEQNYFVGINKLFKNNGITSNELNQRIVELKSNLVEHE